MEKVNSHKGLNHVSVFRSAAAGSCDSVCWHDAGGDSMPFMVFGVRSTDSIMLSLPVCFLFIVPYYISCFWRIASILAGETHAGRLSGRLVRHAVHADYNTL